MSGSDVLGRSIYLDANVPIYFLRGEGAQFEAASRIIHAARDGLLQATVGDAVVSAVMVGAYRAGDTALQQRFRSFFATPGLFRIRQHSTADFDVAARIRAERRVAFVDALHLATAINAGCHAFLTNDNRLNDVGDIPTILLEDVASLDT